MNAKGRGKSPRRPSRILQKRGRMAKRPERGRYIETRP
jgi:hypothetical protein